jgi:hypothetical protein
MSSDVSRGKVGIPRPNRFLLAMVSLLFVLLIAGYCCAQSQGQKLTEAEQNVYAKSHPYLDEPLHKLVKHIPELKKIEAAKDQQDLPLILERTADTVDSFFHHIVDLVADEEIVQARLNRRGAVLVSDQVRVNYLILRHGPPESSQILEYRMDSAGRPMDQVGTEAGYVVTFGFALDCEYFASSFQSQSKFRYLGEQKFGDRDTYVVAFAQKPEQATLFVTLSGSNGKSASLLMQGVAWIDKANFQIIRLRSDLLAPHPEIDLERQTTEVTFNKVELQDVATPLWLPERVEVSVTFKASHDPYGIHYENEHHYTNYRRYRVSVKMVPPQ